ncbi:hypothetical protein RRG08_026677 [Elysia crispata]|uniref:Uncharacterized protein n=1 Tax=Elysia crispata TaxID=231223 RepID=A0AAE1B0V2_9GAST|nr:hypothetical protein RRG08_026677 [Elysia crispata]
MSYQREPFPSSTIALPGSPELPCQPGGHDYLPVEHTSSHEQSRSQTFRFGINAKTSTSSSGEENAGSLGESRRVALTGGENSRASVGMRSGARHQATSAGEQVCLREEVRGRNSQTYLPYTTCPGVSALEVHIPHLVSLAAGNKNNERLEPRWTHLKD